jgi:hypothetical protein
MVRRWCGWGGLVAGVDKARVDGKSGWVERSAEAKARCGDGRAGSRVVVGRHSFHSSSSSVLRPTTHESRTEPLSRSRSQSQRRHQAGWAIAAVGPSPCPSAADGLAPARWPGSLPSFSPHRWWKYMSMEGRYLALSSAHHSAASATPAALQKVQKAEHTCRRHTPATTPRASAPRTQLPSPSTAATDAHSRVARISCGALRRARARARALPHRHARHLMADVRERAQRVGAVAARAARAARHGVVLARAEHRATRAAPRGDPARRGPQRGLPDVHTAEPQCASMRLNAPQRSVVTGAGRWLARDSRLGHCESHTLPMRCACSFAEGRTRARAAGQRTARPRCRP